MEMKNLIRKRISVVKCEITSSLQMNEATNDGVNSYRNPKLRNLMKTQKRLEMEKLFWLLILYLRVGLFNNL